MFDKTSTKQNNRQMDIVICAWCEINNRAVKRYLTWFFIAEQLPQISFKNDRLQQKKIPFNISCDDPNINKAIWKILNNLLKEIVHEGLIPFSSYSLHTVHNAFQKCINNLEGGRVSQLALDLHSWFKDRSCKTYLKVSLLQKKAFFFDMCQQDGSYSPMYWFEFYCNGQMQKPIF